MVAAAPSPTARRLPAWRKTCLSASRSFNLVQAARSPAAAASGAATFSGLPLPTPSGLPLLADDITTLLTTMASATIPTGGSVTVPIVAAQPGTAANLDAGAVPTLGQAIAGVSPVATVAAPGTTGGAGHETADAWRSPSPF